MTSRLKHKLELENINLKSAYLNESFVQVGTPLPELASTKRDKLEYVPEWQQEVRDEKGRRRFHGAFTGGFSAGYFNSVGSKEGWAPTEFKSSRNNRANKVQRPEDFMDEEDLQQMNEDRQLQNTDQFRNEVFAGERKPGDTLPSALESLIAPAQTSIGQKLLQKQGWKQGQGIGPRVSLRKLRIQEGKLGRIRAGVDAEEELPENGAEKHTFAPRDVRLLVYQPKDNRQGLGYERGRGMGRLPQKQTGTIRGNPELEDEDPYDAGPSTSGAFAFDNGDADDDVVVMGGPGPSAERAPAGISDYKQGGERWHDGRPVIPGFALDPLGVPADKWFEMPEIPADWRPRPARVWGTTRKWDETPDHKPDVKEVLRGAPNKPLTFEERGAALGEEQRISQAKSVFEYITEKDRERLTAFAAAAKEQAAPPPPLAMEDEPMEAGPSRRNDEVVIPPLSPRTASAALRGFIPYGDDLDRQERYRSYLSSQTYNTTTPNPVLRQGTIEQVNKELEDFAASARIFKPMSFAMSSRFTSGSASLATSDLQQPKPGLHVYDAEKAKADIESQKAKVEAEPVVKKFANAKEEAAYNGMFGKLTREVKMFYPEKLLCKRFGVPNPHPDGDPSKGEPKSEGDGGGYDSAPLPSNDASWTDAFTYQGKEPTETMSLAETDGEERRPRTIGEVGMADDANQGRDTLTYTKPSIDIFKAIFASDDESDDDNDNNDNASQAGTNGAGAKAKAVGEDPYPVKEEGPVDLQTFKPVFNMRKEEPRERDKKEKKKDKKKRKGVLSFQVGEEGEEEAEEKWKEEKKKRKREGEKQGAGATAAADEPMGVEGEWVEKPSVAPRQATRKGAADFM